ncbi:Rossmann fold domain-containing protein [Novosphingobium sp. 9]|uniref:Rossmann fold domain-containing protein n=1 Tax=Novosphingobium sp. 9 TaxID=2025349 RepID=UPI0021B5ECF8|nr:hypothetical protein [Novosphingobium sp. 9]
MASATFTARISGLPEAPLDAAADFHARVLPEVLTEAAQASAAQPDGLLCLLFAAASYEHREWRLAAVQSLARAQAPLRVNALEGGDEAQVAAALDWLESVPGVTGQLLRLDGNAAG